MLLKKLEGEKKEFDYKRLITIDIETFDGLKGSKFALGSISTYRGTYTFLNLSDFMNFLLSQNKHKLIFAHNLGFDGRFILDYASKYSIEFDVLFYSAGILQIRLKNYKGNWIKIRDSYALFPMSQDKLLESLNLERKLEIDFNKNPSLEQLQKRCEYDAFSLRELLIRINHNLYEIFNVNAITKFTISRLALTIFRTKYLEFNLENPYLKYNKNLQITSVDVAKYSFVRNAYAGGRVEVFDLNLKRNVKSYDINSLYPYVMSKYKIPIAKFHFIRKITLDKFYDFLYTYEGFARVRIRVKKDVKIPLLWFRKNGKLLFPTGEFENTYTFVELREALKYNQIEILDVFEIYYAEESEILFEHFVRDIYSMRKKMKKEKNPFEKILKLIMNSLYGKFGQNPEKNNILFAKNFEQFSEYIENGKELLDMELMAFADKSIHYSNFMLVHISAYITALARLEISRKMIELLEQGKDVLYCDTDSIFTTSHFETSTELGAWKCEFETSIFRAYAPKVYFSEQKIRAKGIPREIIKSVKTLDEFDRLIHSEIEFEKYASIKLMLRRVNNITKYSKMLGYIVTSKKFSLNYDKRIIHKDLTTSPLTIFN